ncbi:MAG: hypothetical protein HQM14_21895 [SAR324 cluster bacterium]|nr:hypothetical protein [SAR324 cluster bacterium]
MKVYLDNCCLNRPFDDQANLRIHLESEAIKAVFLLCEQKHWSLIVSVFSEYEEANTPDNTRRTQLELMISVAKDLQWQPQYSFEDGIKATIDWYLNHQDWVAQVTSREYQKYYEMQYGDR